MNYSPADLFKIDHLISAQHFMRVRGLLVVPLFVSGFQDSSGEMINEKRRGQVQGSRCARPSFVGEAGVGEMTAESQEHLVTCSPP
jgi:hypothetical protein